MSAITTATAPVAATLPLPDKVTLVKPGRFLKPVIEGVVLLLVFLSPWAFASVHFAFEFLLYVGVALLLVLWGLSMLLNGQLAWKRCPVALGLAALLLVGAVQLLPLPAGLLQRLSPATAALYKNLLPAQPEQLAIGEAAPQGELPSGSSLSLYPGATRLAMLRLLAVFCLFVVVRNTIVSPGGLRRLSIVAVLNGLALAVFSLVQFFSAPHYTVYWTYQTDGSVFGPFINRNHFFFYINLCLGLGLGYLLYKRWAAGAQASRDRYPPSFAGGLLQQPAVLWLGAALAVMVSAAFFSLSRGGFVALLGGLLLALIVLWSTSTRSSGLAIWLVTGLLAFGLVAWYGWPRVEERLVTLWASPEKEGRLPMWSNCVPLLKQFPILGTGYGTFRYVEPLQRGPGDDPTVDYEFAHNDYLEAAVEGGAVRLLVSLVVIALVYRLGFRAYRRYRGHATGGLVLGGLVAFTTVVIHSFVEFGLHIPAIVFFVTVLCAQLAGLGGPRASSGEPEDDSYTLRLGGAAGVLALGLTVFLGLVLAAEGWKLSQAERFRLAARTLALKDPPGPRDRQIAYLEKATAYEPADAGLQIALADAYYLDWKKALADKAGPGREREAAYEAARHYLLARSLCPLLPQPHVRLAGLAPLLTETDLLSIYVERATLVRPADPHLWYLAGDLALADVLRANDPAAADKLRAKACASWRQSLLGSDKYLPDMTANSTARGPSGLTTEQWTHDVLPDQPELVKKAAWLLYPEPAAADAREPFLEPALAPLLLAVETVKRQEARKPFLEMALAQLQNRPTGMKATDYHLRAEVQEELGQTDDALASYHLAINRDPHQMAWRLEMAKLLIRQKKYKEAEDALRNVAINDEVLQLLSAVRAGIKEKK